MKRGTVVFVALLIAFAARALRTLQTPEPLFSEVRVLGVAHDRSGGFTVLLAAKSPPPSASGPLLAMVIGVGQAEGTSIAMALGQAQMPRPMTHDLTMEILGRLHVSLTGLSIHSMQHDTYFARLRLASDSRRFDVDCRPSDGIALALRAGAPITVNPKLLREVRFESSEPEPPPRKNAARDDDPGPPKDRSL